MALQKGSVSQGVGLRPGPPSANGTKSGVLQGWTRPTFLQGSGEPGQLGYARVSSTEQELEPQLDRLLPETGRVYLDHGQSGTKGRRERPGMARLLEDARAGDTVTVVKLDRLARSLRELVELAAELEQRSIGLRVLDQGIDTGTASGRLLFGVLASIAEFERSLIVERTRAGMAAAKARGRAAGRPRAITADRARVVARMMAEGHSYAAIGRSIGVDAVTVSRWVRSVEQD